MSSLPYRDAPMRLCCVAEAYPWPPRGGYELRLVHQIEALRSLGEVDVVCLDGSGRPRDPAPDGVRVLDAPEGPERPATRWLPRWAFSRLPRRLLRRDFDAARGRVPTLVADRYDVVLYCHVDGWRATHDLIRGPAILDYDNLEHLAIRGRRALGPDVAADAPGWRRLLLRARWAAVGVLDGIDERRWDRVQRQAATQVERTLVCSELDVGRAGVANVVCLPNGYEGDRAPLDHVELRDPQAPVLLFVGMLGYEPNADAVRWFATEVLPRVRAEVAGATFRVVGRDPDGVADLARVDGVDLVGPVDDLRAELDRADVSVVPIRFGAGTRLKVVEAMANRLPMVSTTVGCEGIDVAHRRELLVADDPSDFAAACVELVRDRDLRRRLLDAAAARYEERYRWSTIRGQLAELVREVAGA